MAEYILEAGGTMAFTFHVLFMLFNLFIIYQFYFNDKFFNELGFSNEEPKLVFRGPPVSYTHLTLPTKQPVKWSGGAV